MHSAITFIFNLFFYAELFKEYILFKYQGTYRMLNTIWALSIEPRITYLKLCFKWSYCMELSTDMIRGQWFTIFWILLYVCMSWCFIVSVLLFFFTVFFFFYIPEKVVQGFVRNQKSALKWNTLKFLWNRISV